MSKFFKSTKPKVETRMHDVADYANVRKPLSKYYAGQIGKTGKTYGGQTVAPLTDIQQQGMGHLRTYAGQTGVPALTQSGANELQNTLNGNYDPSTSLYYKAMRDAAKVNLQNTQNNIADQSAGGGRYWAGARLQKQGEASRDTTNYLNQILGQMAETERGRRFSAAPMAIDAGQAIDAIPLNRASNILNVGDIARQIQQQQNASDYDQWIRANYDYPMQMAQMANNFQATKAPEFQTTVTPGRASGFSRMLGAGVNLASNFINPARQVTRLRGRNSIGGGAGAYYGM